MDDVLRLWRKIVIDQRGDLDQQKHIRDMKTKLGSMQQNAIDNSKKVMTRMSASTDLTLMDLCWQSWNAFVEEYTKNKAFEDAVKKSEQELADFTKRKSEEAQGVLNRMSGSSDSGLVMQCFQGWRDYFLDLKASRQLEEAMHTGSAQMKSLYGKQKGAAKGVMTRLNETESEIFIGTFFHSWAVEAQLGLVIKHYSGKMDQKKHQLDSVQTMFKSFATQLEQGITASTSSPRSKDKSKDKPSQESPQEPPQDKPPQAPAS